MGRASTWFRAGVIATVLCVAAVAPGANAQAGAQGHGDDKGAQQAASPSLPGPEQAALAKLAGEYDRTIKFLGPAGGGMPSFSGTAKISVVLGGRFLLEESTDTVMGQKVEGLRLYGYNNATKQYEMARMYTMSPAITTLSGTSSDDGKTIDYSGSTDNAGASKSPLHAKLRIVSDDEFEVTMSTTGEGGKDAPFQSTTYRRKK